MTCLSSKGGREVAELLGTCRKCPPTFCPSKQILLEGEVGERKGFLILQRISVRSLFTSAINLISG